MKVSFTAALVLILCVGCQSFLGVVTPSTFHNPTLERPHQLEMEIDDKEYQGIAIVEFGKSYQMRINHSGSYKVVMQNCVQFHQYDPSWWTGRSKFSLMVVSKEEREHACSIKITSVTKKKDEEDRAGFIAIRRPGDTLPIYGEANGTNKNYYGTAVLEAAQDALIYMRFDKPVAMVGCGIEDRDISEKTMVMPPGECTIEAVEMGENGREGRVYLLGFKKGYE